MEYTTITGAARILGISQTQASRLLAEGKLKRVGEGIGAYILVTKASVERLKAARIADPPRPGRPRKS